MHIVRTALLKVQICALVSLLYAGVLLLGQELELLKAVPFENVWPCNLVCVILIQHTRF